MNRTQYFILCFLQAYSGSYDIFAKIFSSRLDEHPWITSFHASR